MNWLAVVGYTLVTLISFKSYLKIKTLHVPRSEKFFWLIVSIVLFILIFNKLLNLQTFFTALGRCEAQLSGWYDTRKNKQLVIIAILVMLGLVSLIVFSYLLRNSFKRIWFVLVCFTLKVIFVLVRAVDFHDIDALLRMIVWGWQVNWMFEHGGIALLVLSILIANQQYKNLNSISAHKH